MLIRKSNGIPYSEITPRSTYLNRRAFMAGAAAVGIAGMLDSRQASAAATKLQTVTSPLSTTGLTLTSYKDITSYNNFYEFGVEKDNPAQNAGRMKTRPWKVTVDGLVKQKKTVSIEELLSFKPIEERVYRHRCVEAWSMVIPWAGYSLSELIKWAEPLPKAKYVQFLSLEDASVMPGLREINLNWPYSEGLRMDEAMHPLTLLTFGLYGEVLPNQDGAPVRVVIPWKYGFKSAKSIVKIHFTADQPATAWNDMAPREYGFYSNVNPNVDHPRWSQKTERRIGASIFSQRQPTLMFNGYGDQVASLYNGMDLKKYFEPGIRGAYVSLPMNKRTILALKVAVWLACLTPLALLVYRGFTNDLGPDPTATVTHATGFATLRLLVISLAVTPLRRLSVRLSWLVRFRRLLGLFAFFYGCLHLLTWLWLYSGFSVAAMADDLGKRRYIMMGMAAWLLLVPLAATSTNWSIRKLGGKRWQALHRLAYVSAICGVIHYWWIVKSGVRTPITITLVLVVLLLARVVWSVREIRSRQGEIATAR